MFRPYNPLPAHMRKHRHKGAKVARGYLFATDWTGTTQFEGLLAAMRSDADTHDDWFRRHYGHRADLQSILEPFCADEPVGRFNGLWFAEHIPVDLQQYTVGQWHEGYQTYVTEAPFLSQIGDLVAQNVTSLYCQRDRWVKVSVVGF